MLNFLKRLFNRKATVDSVLAEYNLTRNELKDINLSFRINADKIGLDDLKKICQNEDITIKKDKSQFTAMEIISISSNAITIISFLISLERWISSKTPLECDGQKMPLNKAIQFFLNKIISQLKAKKQNV
jgi:hypothetical protein